MALRVEKISAVTFRVANMKVSVQFYRDVLGMEVLYGGEDAFFSSHRAKDAAYPILNLEQGRSVTGWGADDFLRWRLATPHRVFADAALAGNDRPSRLAAPHLPGPEQAKTGTVPGHDRFGFDDG